MENITKDQSSSSGSESELKSNLDQEIEGGTAKNDSISTFPFLDLLEEVQYKFLKDYLSEEEKKIARLVCRNWNLTCTNKLKLNPPPASDITFRMLQNTSFKFDKLTVTDLTDNSSVQHEELGKFINVIVLNFINTHISVENLQWLLKECVNVEEINIVQSDLMTVSDNRHPCDQFMISKILKCIHTCQNLRSLKICAWYDQRVCTEELVLDCNLLSTCKKLISFCVYSLNPYILVNPTFLPESIVVLHVVLFSKEYTDFDEFLNTSINPFWSYLLNSSKLSPATPVSVAAELENVNSQISSYYRSGVPCSFAYSGTRNVFWFSAKTLPDVLESLGYTTEVKSIASISSNLIEFHTLDFPFSNNNPQ